VADDSLLETLDRQADAWNKRPLLRALYREWQEVAAARLSAIPGESVELGAGIGRFKDVAPSVRATDVETTPWVAEVVDAENLPFDAATVANLVLFDVFHHLARPARFFDEARRVLAPGGRVVIVDPYCSPLSTFAYRRFHRELTDLSAPPLEPDERVAASPLASNQARATLVFFRHADRFRRRWPELEIIERRRFAVFLYALSGGYSRRPLAHAALYRPLAAVERLLAPLAPLAGFRCLVVLERRAGGHETAKRAE
jgi:SAM-dependent methyltransferase